MELSYKIELYIIIFMLLVAGRTEDRFLCAMNALTCMGSSGVTITPLEVERAWCYQAAPSRVSVTLGFDNIFYARLARFQ